MSKSYMTTDQKTALVKFLKERREQYPNNRKCFAAAVTELALPVRMSDSMVHTYMNKAKGVTEPKRSSIPKTMDAPAAAAEAPRQFPKRKYTKRNTNGHLKKLEVHVNYCPNCGCNLQSVATGIAMGA